MANDNKLQEPVVGIGSDPAWSTRARLDRAQHGDHVASRLKASSWLESQTIHKLLAKLRIPFLFFFFCLCSSFQMARSAPVTLQSLSFLDVSKSNPRWHGPWQVCNLNPLPIINSGPKNQKAKHMHLLRANHTHHTFVHISIHDKSSSIFVFVFCF